MPTQAIQHLLPSLMDIDEVRPVDDRDAACMEEVRAVLERHGSLERFGLVLLHQHFDLAADEVLVETIDVENRILTTQPHKANTAVDAIETVWRFDGPRGQRCERQCVQDRDAQGNPFHRGAHYTTG